jgi:hypothetical protein
MLVDEMAAMWVAKKVLLMVASLGAESVVY